MDQTERRKEGSQARKLSHPKIQVEEPSHTIEDSGAQQNQEFNTGNNDEQPDDKETWISQVACAEEPPTSFDELNDTSFDFFAFLEYHFEECSKATTEPLDWHNPENKPYPFDLRKPLPLIQDHRGRQIIPKDYFINNDLEYLKGGDLSRRYSTSMTKTKAATYDLKWIEDLVPEL
ncbi:hypothetical protein Tco_1281087 [Tanacetum coccineum]